MNSEELFMAEYELLDTLEGGEVLEETVSS